MPRTSGAMSTVTSVDRPFGRWKHSPITPGSTCSNSTGSRPNSKASSVPDSQVDSSRSCLATATSRWAASSISSRCSRLTGHHRSPSWTRTAQRLFDGTRLPSSPTSSATRSTRSSNGCCSTARTSLACSGRARRTPTSSGGPSVATYGFRSLRRVSEETSRPTSLAGSTRTCCGGGWRGVSVTATRTPSRSRTRPRHTSTTSCSRPITTLATASCATCTRRRLSGSKRCVRRPTNVAALLAPAKTACSGQRRWAR